QLRLAGQPAQETRSRAERHRGRDHARCGRAACALSAAPFDVTEMFDVRYSYLLEQFADPSPTLAEIGRLVATGDFPLGKPVAEFERRFADLIGVKHAIGVGSG